MTAESIGLAIRVRIARALAQTLTRLVVFGVREGAAAAGSQPALESLLERHSREEGVALLAAGTPTNNTPTARVSKPPAAIGAVPGRGSDAARLALAFGMNSAAFANASETPAATDSLVEAMHTALWPATFGYLFEPLLSPMLDASAIARARTLFQKSVRPRWPYPTLALGNQPYGVLPVSSLGMWRNAQGTEDPLASVLDSLSMYPVEAAARARFLAERSNADLGARLLNALAQSPVSVRWLARTVQSSLIAAFDMLGAPVSYASFATIVDEMYRRRTAGELSRLGFSGTPFLLDLLLNEDSFLLNLALVAPSEASRTAPLPANYIDAVANAEVDALRNQSVAGSSPQTLLYLILRQATLLVMGRVANRFQGASPAPPIEPVFVEDADLT